jgi:hypothetical protein
MTAHAYYCDRCLRISPVSGSDEAARKAAKARGWYIGKREIYCPVCLGEWRAMAKAAGIELKEK